MGGRGRNETVFSCETNAKAGQAKRSSAKEEGNKNKYPTQRIEYSCACPCSWDVGEWELVDNNADNMDGGVLETDDANYDDQDGKEYTHDTCLIDANVMDNDKSEDNELPARFKECYF